MVDKIKVEVCTGEFFEVVIDKHMCGVSISVVHFEWILNLKIRAGGNDMKKIDFSNVTEDFIKKHSE